LQVLTFQVIAVGNGLDVLSLKVGEKAANIDLSILLRLGAFETLDKRFAELSKAV
jgi:hypothetical protein